MEAWIIIILSVVVLLLIIGSVIWSLLGNWIVRGQHKIADGSHTYAIILGAKVDGKVPSLSLQYRLKAAVAYGKKYEHVHFVLSGGQGKGEHITEAEAMRRYLVADGIDETRLTLEQLSTSTYENITYALQLIPNDVETITIISSDYHVARAIYIAKKLGVNADAVIAQTPAIVRKKLALRERIALLKTWITRK